MVAEPSTDVYFADEIWLEILRPFADDEYRPISLVSRQLRRICLPVIFKHFDFRPRPETAGVAGSDLANGEIDAMERLRFYSSPRIAPLVLTCDITKIPTNLTRIPLPMRGDDPAPLQASFFDNLSSFTHLKRLRVLWVHLTIHDLTCLARQHTLESLWVMGCPLSLLHVDSLKKSWELPSLVWRPEEDDKAGEELEAWLSLMKMDRGFRLELLDGLTASTASCLGVTHLGTSGNSLANFAPVLRFFPNIKILNIVPDYREIASVNPTVPELAILDPDISLLLLEDLTASAHLLSAFLPLSAQIKRLHVFVIDFDLLVDPLHSGYHNLATLVASAPFVYADEFLEAISHLAALEKCKIYLKFWWDPDPEEAEKVTASEFFTDLISFDLELPTTLTHLAITLLDDFESYAIPHGFIDPVTTVNGYRKRCSRLELLWLDGKDFLIDWQSRRDGPSDRLQSFQAELLGPAFEGRAADASGKFMERLKPKDLAVERARLEKIWAHIDPVCSRDSLWKR